MEDDIQRLIKNLTCITPNSYRLRSHSCENGNKDLAPKLG